MRRRLARLSVGPRSSGGAPSRDWTAAAHAALLGALGRAEWRREWTAPDGDSRPDLRGASFAGATLEGVDLSFCRLDGAIFDGASLAGAVLTGAELRSASFRGANLTRARLDAANAQDAWLDDATLESASLAAGNFAFVSARRANLTGADLRQATFCDADLRNARVAGSDRLQCDFEGADTTCVTGAPAPPSDWWSASAKALNTPAFTTARRHYLALLHLDARRSEPGLRAIEAALHASGDVDAELRALLAGNWRDAIVAAAACCLTDVGSGVMEAVWRALEQSWVSPQLAATAALCDRDFLPRASAVLAKPDVRPKSRRAIAEVLALRHADAVERNARLRQLVTDAVHSVIDGRDIAARWLGRLEQLTIPC